jgi:hypothetical protein
MNNEVLVHFMADNPMIDEFIRHLQHCLEDSNSIPDLKERENRQWQLESALQEALIFKNRYNELVQRGIDPLRMIEPKEKDPAPPMPTKSEALMVGTNHCKKCNAHLESDIDFCPACGTKL